MELTREHLDLYWGYFKFALITRLFLFITYKFWTTIDVNQDKDIINSERLKKKRYVLFM